MHAYADTRLLQLDHTVEGNAELFALEKPSDAGVVRLIKPLCISLTALLQVSR